MRGLLDVGHSSPYPLSQSAEAERLKDERIAEYAARKSKSELGLLAQMPSHSLRLCQTFLSAEPAVVAKSSIILDVKPWDDETGVLAKWLLVRGSVILTCISCCCRHG